MDQVVAIVLIISISIVVLVLGIFAILKMNK